MGCGDWRAIGGDRPAGRTRGWQADRRVAWRGGSVRDDSPVLCGRGGARNGRRDSCAIAGCAPIHPPSAARGNGTDYAVEFSHCHSVVEDRSGVGLWKYRRAEARRIIIAVRDPSGGNGRDGWRADGRVQRVARCRRQRRCGIDRSCGRTSGELHRVRKDRGRGSCGSGGSQHPVSDRDGWQERRDRHARCRPASGGSPDGWRRNALRRTEMHCDEPRDRGTGNRGRISRRVTDAGGGASNWTRDGSGRGRRASGTARR